MQALAAMGVGTRVPGDAAAWRASARVRAGMIFGKLIEEVLWGRKTVTRRRLVHRDGRPLRYRAGGVYTVQPGRGQPHWGHLKVTSVSALPLGDGISVDEARREGFPAPPAFMEYWMALHGGWDRNEIVARIEFEIQPRCEVCRFW